MLYIVTGSNGAGKTLLTLKWVMERAEKEGRPVCHNGRFEPTPGGPLANWKKISFSDWQAEPDGTIFLIDECHNDLPVRPASAPVPDPVKMLAEHRRRGMDFYLITQHPQNIDSFVRRLVGSPGWHRHLKRTFGADMVSCIEWDAVNAQCEKQGSGRSGTVTMKSFPKEVYKWYASASLHTGKKKIPPAVFIFLAGVVLIPTLFYYAFVHLPGSSAKGKEQQVAPQGVSAGTSPQGANAGPLTTPAWLDLRKPRLPDFPHTAPLYDDVTRPTVAPYPAACISMKSQGCKCFTQQGTLIPSVSKEVCLQVVKQGYFVEWQQPSQPMAQQPQIAATPQSAGVTGPAAPHPLTALAAPQPSPVQLDPHSQALATRNSQVRSSLTR